MTTFDLTSPRPVTTLLDALPRRVTLTLRELSYAASLLGEAPLPFEVRLAKPDALTGRLGVTSSDSDDDAFDSALASLHDPQDTLARRGLLVDDNLDAGVAGALGILAAPAVAVDLDLRVGNVQAKCWQRAVAGAVATLSTVDGIVFDLAWFDATHWPLELARVAVLPEEHEPSASGVPTLVDLPFDLTNAAAEAAGSRPELVSSLVSQHSGAVIDGDGRPVADAEVVGLLLALHNEVNGRLRVLMSRVAHEESVPVGVVSWVLLADGWRALRPHHEGDESRVEIRTVEPGDLASSVAPVLSKVSR